MNTATQRPARFCLVRVDDRLLHGQVVLNWVPRLRPRRIAIVDDAVAADQLAASLLPEAVPAGIALWIGTVAQAAPALLKDPGWPPESTLVLVRSPAAARALYESGVRYERLNLGCLRAMPERSRVRRQVHLSPEESEALRYLASSGVAVSVQVVPSETALSLEAALRRVSRFGQRRGST